MKRCLSSRFLLSTTPPQSPVNSTAAEPPNASVEPDFVIIIAALLCALICAVGLITVARCAWLRRGASGSPASSAANKGLKKKVLQSLPKFSFDPSVATGGDAECAICLTEYREGDEIRILPQCGHGFHVQCIDTWLGSHSSCPSCRQILVVGRCRKCGELSEVPGTSHGAQIQANSVV